ncbi:MAG: CoA activase [Deltaproteobacteria bacterium]|nr:CoA activase [Deltaproteobacteria bacterium]MBW1938353.1 CoA activase [Deltaproteobacteria bacterium]MBW2351054.1 CoA activase [Deltaproteobacteria bacterium]
MEKIPIKNKKSTGDSDLYYVGIDAGSVSLNCIVINDKMEIVYESPYERHLGKVEEGVLALIHGLYEKFGQERIRSISFTGNHGKKLGEELGTFYEFETISQVLGSIYIRPDVKTIISMGGQETALLQINHYDGGWELEYFNTNGPCASGTGSFIDQQAQRLATTIYTRKTDFIPDEIDKILAGFIKLGLKSQRPANVACRCTVFTKSDMIHLQNKGEKLEDIIYGLHVGNARNYMSTIVSNRVLEEPILFIGGLSLNNLQVKAFKSYFPGLIVPPYNTSIGAMGVALGALESNRENRVDLDVLKTKGFKNEVSVPVAPRLALKQTTFPETNEIEKKSLRKMTRVYLGIDVGSTTTKYALINESREIIHKTYLPTHGKPIEVTQGLLARIRDDVGKKIEIVGTATTGSGRNVVGDFLNADLIIDEITAHARGAVEICPEVDTIFEIGGQDSKYISISNTYPLDFDMNKVCAAGTGSFLHELANKYGINIVGEFQEIALSSEKPVKLAERCTVFMESDLVSYLQKGLERKDLIAGLCYAIVYNYLNRVIGKRRTGQKVMFLGGPSLNKGVVAAFENVLGRGLLVPRHREVLGAYGAAISVQEKMRLEGKNGSTFRGLDNAIKDRMEYAEKICRADPHCHNRCKLKIYNFDGRRSIWGGECGRYELSRSSGPRRENLFELRQEVWQAHMAGVYTEMQGEPRMEIDNRPTVGMQRALYGHQLSIMWAHFFDKLGLRLVLSPPTNAHISKTGIETVMAETCYPVKVSHGHIKELLGKTRFLFLPSIINMPTPEASEAGFYCPMLQSNSYMVRMALSIDPSNILSPVIHLSYDPGTLAMEISEQIQSKLDVSRAEIEKALCYALDRQNRFVRELYQKGRKILEDQDSDEPIVVVTGRPYNLYDERLNLRLGKNLSKIGVAALPMDFIDISLVDLSDFPSMYWGLGAQVLRTARFVKDHPNYFGLHLTNFGCGPDSFIEHFYKHIMGDKAYLILELDEHSAVAGVMTRLEAYKNVIENTMQKSSSELKFDLKVAN